MGWRSYLDKPILERQFLDITRHENSYANLHLYLLDNYFGSNSRLKKFMSNMECLKMQVRVDLMRYCFTYGMCYECYCLLKREGGEGAKQNFACLDGSFGPRHFTIWSLF